MGVIPYIADEGNLLTVCESRRQSATKRELLDVIAVLEGQVAEYARQIEEYALQIEAHPYLTQEKLIRLANEYGIHVTAFSPLGALSYVELDIAGAGDSVLTESVVKAAAEAHGKTPAQVVLRWGVQRDTSIIPKTTKPGRMRENLAIDDFQLSDNEMTAISGLNANRRFNDPGVFCEAAFDTFHPIYD